MKNIFGSLMFFGFLLFLGTAGASDAGTIDGSQIWLQVSIAVCMIGSGYIGIKATDKIKEEKRHKKRTPQQTNTGSVLGCQQSQLQKDCQPCNYTYIIHKKKGMSITCNYKN